MTESDEHSRHTGQLQADLRTAMTLLAEVRTEQKEQSREQAASSERLDALNDRLSSLTEILQELSNTVSNASQQEPGLTLRMALAEAQLKELEEIKKKIVKLAVAIGAGGLGLGAGGAEFVRTLLGG
tara:strand:- start:6813 stop:7193 length:381 start_codon:yes stop_codon:yes gene_type:complete